MVKLSLRFAGTNDNLRFKLYAKTINHQTLQVFHSFLKLKIESHRRLTQAKEVITLTFNKSPKQIIDTREKCRTVVGITNSDGWKNLFFWRRLRLSFLKEIRTTQNMLIQSNRNYLRAINQFQLRKNLYSKSIDLHFFISSNYLPYKIWNLIILTVPSVF